VAVSADTLRLRDLTGDMVEVARRSGRPDPLHVQIGLLASPPGGLTMLPPRCQLTICTVIRCSAEWTWASLIIIAASNPPCHVWPAGRKPGALELQAACARAAPEAAGEDS